jgi:hypothetical protein
MDRDCVLHLYFKQQKEDVDCVLSICEVEIWRGHDAENSMPRLSRSVACVVAICVVAATANASSALLEPGPTQSPLYFSPIHHNGTLIGPAGSSGGALDSLWEVSQWTNPDPVTEAVVARQHGTLPTRCPPNSSWGVETRSSRVCVTRGAGGGQAVELAASGDGTGLKCGKEFDMFLSPVGHAYPHYKVNMAPVGLGDVHAIRVTATIELAHIRTRKHCGTTACGAHPDYGYVTLGLPFHTAATRPGQVNFFQIGIYDSRWAECKGSSDMCDADKPWGWYFDKSPRFGVTVAAPSFRGNKCLRGGNETVTFDADVLPVIREAIGIAAKRFGGHPVVADWSLGGLYVGSGLQGATTMTTRVSNITIDIV